MTIKTSLWVTAFICTIALVFFLSQTMQNKNINIVTTKFGGEFTLTNHLNKKVTHKDFENQYRLIYFGFTYCPAICPTELQRIAHTLKELGIMGEKIQPLFITVDPERDTVDVMKNYVALFHPRLIGLTGTQLEINNIKKAYKVYSKKIITKEMTDYTVDHSSYIYFMGPHDNLIKIFKVNDPVEKIIKEVKEVLKKSSLQ